MKDLLYKSKIVYNFQYMDSFQRSQYSIFNKNKRSIDKNQVLTPQEAISFSKKTASELPQPPNSEQSTVTSNKTTPELPKNTILNTNLMGNDPEKKKQQLNNLLWLFGLVLVAILFFSIGYYLKNNLKTPPTVNIEEKDLGIVLAEKYDEETVIESGSVVIKIWTDGNNDGKKSSWETNRYGFGAQIRKAGEKSPFLYVESDGEGVIRLTGLNNDEDYEIFYFEANNYDPYNPNRDFWGANNYEIFDSTDGSTGKIFGDWRPLKVGQDGTELILGLREYKPEKLITTLGYGATLYDLEGKQFASGGNFSSSSLPNKVEIRNNNLFYVKDGNMYKNNPIINMAYSARAFDQLAMSDTSFWAISPSGTSIIYGDHNGTYFQNENNACTKQQLYYENKPLGLYTQSFPPDTVGVRFGDDYRAIVYASVENNYGYYLVNCNNSQISVKKLPIERQWYGGYFAKNDRFILKGPITFTPVCEQTTDENGVKNTCPAQTYGEGLYVYKLNDNKVEKIGGDELNTTYFAAEAYDGRYAILANTEADELKILNFDSADEIKILNFNIKPFFNNYDRHGLTNGFFSYLGKDRFMFMDHLGQCNGQEVCATVKEFKIQGTNINVTELIKIKDLYPTRIIGEITK